jgi:hypothetical protein
MRCMRWGKGPPATHCIYKGIFLKSCFRCANDVDKVWVRENDSLQQHIHKFRP